MNESGMNPKNNTLLSSVCAGAPLEEHGCPLSFQQWKELRDLAARPALYQPGESAFWTDPHIASVMLTLHLDPEQEAASRKRERIHQEIDWLFDSGAVREGDKLLDLGCGPGLYAVELARRGVRVTGLDSSEGSLMTARQLAEQNNVPLELKCMDFFELCEEETYDAILQVYGEMNVFPPQQRDRLLHLLHSALKPGGRLTFDVTTRKARQRVGERNGWAFHETGFWAKGPHLVLNDGFDYPEHNAWVDQYVVVEPDRTRVFRNWFTDCDAADVTRFAEKKGYVVEGLSEGLSQALLTEESEWIGVRLKKK